MFNFGKTNDFENDVKRNAFDMSFSTNATFKMGTLYPVFCKEVYPTDSWKIDPKVAIQMMPTVFPLKTRLRCFMHFYYVKNRTLWKDWQKFISNNYGQGNGTDIVHPYIYHDYDCNLHGTGSLADYLGFPTALPEEQIPINAKSRKNDVQVCTLREFMTLEQFNTSLREFRYLDKEIGQNIVLGQETQSPYWNVFYSVPNAGTESMSSIKSVHVVGVKVSNPLVTPKVFVYDCETTDTFGTIKILDKKILDISAIPSGGRFEIDVDNMQGNAIAIMLPDKNDVPDDWLDTTTISYESSIVPKSDGFDVKFPWWNTMHVSALPFRAYQAVYNAYYRNWQVDPLKNPDGSNNYDTYVENNNGGRDENDYILYKRNYEKDMFTSANTSPQQGTAPLVGITTTGEATFALDGREYKLQAVFEDDNETIKTFKMTGDIRLPQDVMRAAVNTQGISINDLRAVNSLQRYLENGIRASYKYRNQIGAHFGRKPEFDAVDMPQFIGGIAMDLYQNVLQTTAETDAAPAGTPISNGYFAHDKAGYEINKYCDEHGFIIGILSIVPVPNYPQGLSKQFRKTSYLDYYSPEFGHLSYQPIRSNEISLFSQAPDTSAVLVDDSETFGYNRSWYDLCGSVDEVHGDFRTSLRSYMLTRWFSDSPKLDDTFLQVNPDYLSDVFADTSDTDKFIGQIQFNCTAVRPLPEYGNPKLE